MPRRRFKMEKKDIAIITLFLVLIVMTGLFYFNDSINITGFAVKEEKTQEFYGTYSIKPSFKVNVDYDFEDYEEIKNKAKEIVRDCKDDVENCVNKKINIFNDEEVLKAREYNLKRKFEWGSGCETEEEKFFYDFVENYKLCLDSEEKEGICEFSLGNGPKDVELKIKITEVEDGIKFELLQSSLKETVNTKNLFVIEGLKGDKINKELHSDITLTIDFDENGLLEDAWFKASGWIIKSYIRGDVKLYKEIEQEKTIVSFINPSQYTSFEVLSRDLVNKKFKKINLIKNTFKFCVKSNKEFYVYDEDKIELKNTEYNFALKLIEGSQDSLK